MDKLLTTLWAGCAAAVAGGVAHSTLPLLVQVAHKLHFFDRPNTALKNHKQPIPYLGGVAVYLGAISSLALLFPVSTNIWFMLIGTTLLLFLGLIDDIVVLSPGQKWWGQFVAACCFMRGGFYLKEQFLLAYAPTCVPYLWPIISMGWTLTIINAFNLIDVMDGLATTNAFIIAIVLAVAAMVTQSYAVVILLGALIGALVAFMVWNRPPAAIYLGDSGALCIGGFLASIPFMIPWGSFSVLGFLAPLMIFFVPLAEVGMLIIIRTLRGIPVYQGSRDHFCHYLQRKGWSTHKILYFVGAISLINGAGAIAFMCGYLSLLGWVVQGIICGLFWIITIFIQDAAPYAPAARS